jgi:hypothetical protein
MMHATFHDKPTFNLNGLAGGVGSTSHARHTITANNRTLRRYFMVSPLFVVFAQTLH